MFYCEYEKNTSPKTIENYSLWLSRLVSYIGDISVYELKPMEVLDFRMRLTQQGLSKKTINYHIVSIRAFLKFLIKNDYDVLSPDKLELAKIPFREVQYLGEEDVDKILHMPRQIHKNPIAIARDEAILRFLYGTGLRVSELTHLMRSQIKSDSKQFSVIGK